MMDRLQKNIKLSTYTTLHVGGVADYLIEVTTKEELETALRWAKAHTAMPSLILGGGSNVLIHDEGYRGLTILNRITELSYREEGEKVFLTVGAGNSLDEVIADTVEKGYWGLENLSAIPGTVGATPVQNVGAYGVEVSELIDSAVAVHRDTFEEKIFTKQECLFGYRDSYFKSEEGSEWCIATVTFVLSTISTPRISYADLSVLAKETPSQKEIREAVIRVRSKKFPDWTTVGTAGSFFKNPIIANEGFVELQQQYKDIPGYVQPNGEVKVSLGWILDRVCGLKGYRLGTVRLFEEQALVLVADENATAEEIDLFAKKIEEKVFEKTKIKIEREVKKYF
jgi:UDP-N-acetylmuramate dehydrogenase